MKRLSVLFVLSIASCAAALSSAPDKSPPASNEPALSSGKLASTPPVASLVPSASASSVPSEPLSRDAIRSVIRSWYPEIKGCYERQFQKNSKLKGQVIARFMIGESGKVNSVDMSSSTIKAPQVVECVGKLFSLMEFPLPANGMVLITYPIEFDWEDAVH